MRFKTLFSLLSNFFYAVKKQRGVREEVRREERENEKKNYSSRKMHTKHEIRVINWIALTINHCTLPSESRTSFDTFWLLKKQSFGRMRFFFPPPPFSSFSPSPLRPSLFPPFRFEKCLLIYFAIKVFCELEIVDTVFSSFYPPLLPPNPFFFSLSWFVAYSDRRDGSLQIAQIRVIGTFKFIQPACDLIFSAFENNFDNFLNRVIRLQFFKINYRNFSTHLLLRASSF